MKKSDVRIDADGIALNLRFEIYDYYVKDGKPLGLDKKPLRTIIHQRWRDDKWRMDYNAHSNMETTTWHLKGFEDLEHHIKRCLRHGHIIEIIPDYDRPVDQKY